MRKYGNIGFLGQYSGAEVVLYRNKPGLGQDY